MKIRIYVIGIAVGACLVAFGQDMAAQLAQLTDGTIASKVVIFTSSGSEASLTGGTQVAEGSVFTSGTATNLAGVRRCDTPGAGTGVADGDVATMCVDANGRLRIAATIYNSSGTELTPNDVTEDAAETGGEKGPLVQSIRRDAAAASAGTTGDNATVNTDALGLLWTRLLDPCSGVAKTYIPIDITTATTTELTASLAGSGNYYYICAFNIVTTAANNVSLVDDDTDNCASVTSGIIGGLTAGEGWNFAANGGIALGSGMASVMRTNGTNRVICMVTSAATETHGHMVVVAAP